MAVIYVTGNVKGAGKTSLATALAQRSLQSGISTSLVKPISLDAESDGSADAEKDFVFFSQLNPSISYSQNPPMFIAPSSSKVDSPAIERSVAEVNEAKRRATNVIVEGLDWFLPAAEVNPTTVSVIKELDAKIVLVLRYSNSVDLTKLIRSIQEIGTDLIGVILNGVTIHRSHYVASIIVPAFKSSGIKMLGVVPEDRRMLAPSVSEIADHLNAEILLAPDNCEELVDYFMVGGWFLDKGDYVFDRRQNKAVIVRADRPDLHMAALQTSTVCLILTGGQNPIQYITYHADQLGIPLLSASEGTVEVMEKLESIAERTAAPNPRKISRFDELLAQFTDLEALSKVLERN